MDFQSSCHQWSQSQLLSYVLNGASRYQNVDDMAAEFSTQFKSLSHLMQMDEKALCSIKEVIRKTLARERTPFTRQLILTIAIKF